MKRAALLLAGLLLLFVIPAASAQKRVSETEQVRRFVQGFYDWYGPILVNEKLKEPAFNVALRERRSYFTARLYRALKLDSDAEKNDNSGDIVGLDADPFGGGQDPYEFYKVGSISRHGSGFWVDVHALANGKVLAKDHIIAVVVKERGNYRFANFHDPEVGGDLLTQLNGLRKDRESEAKKHKRH